MAPSQGRGSEGEPLPVLAGRHRRACQGFTAVTVAFPPDGWDRPTPCSEWDAAALVEHVIGFHEFLLLRPLRVRATRPRAGPAARWAATATAIEEALAHPDLGRPVEYFDGEPRRPADVLGAITGDVLIHTWDLGRAGGATVRFDEDLCDLALRAARAGNRASGSGLYQPPVAVPPDVSPQDRLVALSGRDPGWRAPNPR